MRTDVAAECLKEKAPLPEGVCSVSRELGNGKLCLVEINTAEAAEKIGKPKGIYVTLEGQPLWQEDGQRPELVEAMAEGLRQLLPEEGTVLVVGLGNRDITPDALGPLCAEKILVTRHLRESFPELRSAAALAPNVLGKTGMETLETVRALVGETEPAAVIVVDAMAAASLERLGTTVQLSNTGIVPGAGVLNARKALNEETLGRPVVALGIPTVVDLSSVSPEVGGEPMMCTPRQVDQLVQRGAAFLAAVINRALQPGLSLEELLLLQA